MTTALCVPGCVALLKKAVKWKSSRKPADGQEAIRLVRKTAPDVAVIDISMPGLDGLEVISQLAGL